MPQGPRATLGGPLTYVVLFCELTDWITQYKNDDRWGTWLAQSIQRATLNLRVLSSSRSLLKTNKTMTGQEKELGGFRVLGGIQLSG